MTAEIAVSKTLSLRECGYDEHWLQGQIEDDPSMLGLGDLEVVRREKQQSSGGKLDILLNYIIEANADPFQLVGELVKKCWS